MILVRTILAALATIVALAILTPLFLVVLPFWLVSALTRNKRINLHFAGVATEDFKVEALIENPSGVIVGSGVNPKLR